MSKLFYRFKSLSNYLKCHKLLDDSYEPILFKSKSESEIIEEYIKCFSLLDYSYNVPFNDKYKEFIDEGGVIKHTQKKYSKRCKK